MWKKEMARRRIAEEDGARDEAANVGDAFQQMAHKMVPEQAHFEEALRLKEFERRIQEAERKTENIIRNAQEALRLQKQEFERRIQDAERKTENAIRNAQEALRLQKQAFECRIQDAERKTENTIRNAQEALRLQKQEAELNFQEALRLQKQAFECRIQEAELKVKEAEMKTRKALRLQLTTLTVSREMERKLQEADDIIRVLQQELDEMRKRGTAVNKRTRASEGFEGGRGLLLIEGRVENDHTSTDAKLSFLPHIQAVHHELKDRQSSRVCNATAAFPLAASALETPATGRVAASGKEKPPPPKAYRSISSRSSFTTTSSVASEAPTTEWLAAGGGEGPTPPVSVLVPSPSPSSSSSSSASSSSFFTSSTSSSSSTSSGADYRGPSEEGEKKTRLRILSRMRRVQLMEEEVRKSPSSLEEMLMRATREGKLTDVRRLIDSGADVNCLDLNGCSPLSLALYFDAPLDLVAFLLQRGANVCAINCFGFAALHFVAVRPDSRRRLDLLVSAGADVNARNMNGETPLHLAAYLNNEEAVRALLAAGARKDLKPWGGDGKNTFPIDLASTPTLWQLLSL